MNKLNFLKTGLLTNVFLLFSLIFICVILFMAIAGPFLISNDPNSKNLKNRRSLPNKDHYFGTDNLGRDILSRIVYGSRITLISGFVSRSISLFFGMIIGITAARSKGLIDNILMRITDSFLAFPSLLLSIGISLAIGPGLWTIILSLAIAGWADIARITRSCVLNISEYDYISASKSFGAKEYHIICFHIIPNLIPSLIVVWAMGISTSIMGEASLSFLGLGISEPAASWGSMVQRGFLCLSSEPWIALIPGIFISLTVISINTISDHLNDYINPLSLKKGAENAI